MEKKLTNSGPLREPADKHSICTMNKRRALRQTSSKPRPILTRLWPFLSRQGGERVLTIDDLCERSHYRRRTAHAAPARSYLTRLSPFCATLFPAGLGPRANLALGRASGTWGSYCDGCLADHGVGPGAAVHELPPGPQPGHLVSAP